MISPETLWITGGEDPQPTGTSEFVTLSNNGLIVEDGPKLPIDVLGHCMIAINDSATSIEDQIIMMIGGYNPYMLETNKTFFYHALTGWYVGPPLNYARRVHACGVLKLQDEKRYVVVSGGASDQNPSVQQSVEMLNLDNIEHGFVSYPSLSLPKPLYAHSMVSTGNSVFVLGGIEGKNVNQQSEDIFELQSDNNGLSWKKLDQKLKHGRSNMVAMMIPDYLANCELN